MLELFKPFRGQCSEKQKAEILERDSGLHPRSVPYLVCVYVTYMLYYSLEPPNLPEAQFSYMWSDHSNCVNWYHVYKAFIYTTLWVIGI